MDFNLGTNHRLSGSASNLWATRDPDYLNDTEERFPGAPNYTKFQSVRPLYAISLRSTLNSNMVNELPRRPDVRPRQLGVRTGV